MELALASYPGFTLTSPPGEGTPYGVYWPSLVEPDDVDLGVPSARLELDRDEDHDFRIGLAEQRNVSREIAAA